MEADQICNAVLVVVAALAVYFVYRVDRGNKYQRRFRKEINKK